MAGPAPVMRLIGRVHDVNTRVVQPAEAKPAERDENGRVTRRAQDARDGYTVLDVVVLTDSGGFCTVLLREEALSGRSVPAAGEEVNWPVRPFIGWDGPEWARHRVVGLSVATDLYVAESAEPSRGSRSAAATS